MRNRNPTRPKRVPHLGYLFAPFGYIVGRMDQDSVARAASFQRAVLEQLNAEASAAGYSIKSLAAAVGKDYSTFRRYLNGERDIPPRLIWQTIDALGVPPEVFTDRARRRLEQR